MAVQLAISIATMTTTTTTLCEGRSGSTLP